MVVRLRVEDGLYVQYILLLNLFTSRQISLTIGSIVTNSGYIYGNKYPQIHLNVRIDHSTDIPSSSSK